MILRSLLFVLLGLSSACTKNTLSERDQRLEQIRNNADKKRRELSGVAKETRGFLTFSDGKTQNVVLHLEIQDIPHQEAGQVDPVMIPELRGYLWFVFGQEASEWEYLTFPLEKADYNASAKKLNLVLTNEVYKNLLMELTIGEASGTGGWTAPSLGGSGTIKLFSNPAPQQLPLSQTLKGSYLGTLKNTHPDANLPSRIQVSLVTSQDPSKSADLKISGKMRLYYDENFTEWDEWDLEKMEFNAFTHQLVAKTAGNEKFTLKLEVSQGTLSGLLFEDALGELATVEVTKQ